MASQARQFLEARAAYFPLPVTTMVGGVAIDSALNTRIISSVLPVFGGRPAVLPPP